MNELVPRAGFLMAAVDQSFEVPAEMVSAIVLHAGAERVRVIEGQPGCMVSARLYGSATIPPALERSLQSGELAVSLRRSIFRFRERLAIDLVVPPAKVMDLDLSVRSGSLEGRDIVASKLSLAASSGRIEVDSAKAADIAISATSGRIEAGAIEASKVSVEASSGSVEAGRIAAGSARIACSSGRIQASVVAAGSLIAEASSGRLDIGRCATSNGRITLSSGRLDIADADGSFEIEASSGRVNVEFSEGADISGNIGCSSGRIDVGLPRSARIPISATVSSGRVDSDFPRLMVEEERAQLRLSASSGRITVRER